jgi:predicted ATPase/class 3 adenylate cyclase
MVTRQAADRTTGSLPVGTVTFMLTDIEGSTRMWREHPREMLSAVERHRELIRSRIHAHGGGLPRDQGEGDSFVAVFSRATKAVTAALDVQRALAAEPWPEATSLKVRIALHTGEAELRNGNYYGSSVSRAARVRALAWGGQTLLSQSTYELTKDRLPDGASITDLGSHPLKDFEGRDQIYQLCHPDLVDDFPPLRLREPKSHNLPLMLTTFVGREKEIADLAHLVSVARLVTLTGPGGSGKTRLAIESAKELLHEFEDGVHFIDLASVEDPHSVLFTITQNLGVHENPGQSTFETLAQTLEEKHLLLILDNFERVLTAAPLISQLLLVCPRLSTMVTSRASLQLRGEYEFPVLPLELPPLDDLPPPEELGRFGAMRLFCERASAASFGFSLNAENGRIVAEICHRLDGLPLAIELAAAKVKILPLPMLLERLSSRLQVLTGGARDLPARQQTLRGLIDWDYEILTDREQDLFRRISVCAGSFSLECAAAIAGFDEMEALEVIESLMGKSLLRPASSIGGEPRFRMLQTIREYAREMLASSGELEGTRRRHAAFYLEVAEEGAAQLRGPQQVEWLRRLELDHENFRGALEWTDEQGNPDLELRLVAALSYFWITRGHLSEGERWLQAAESRSTGHRSALRAEVLRAAAVHARAHHDVAAGERYLTESLSLQREMGDRSGIAAALKDLGNMRADEGDVEDAQRLYQESLEYWRSPEDDAGIGQTLNNLGYMAFIRGDLDAALEAYGRCITIFERMGDKQGIARGLMNLGATLREQGDLEKAGDILKKSLVLWQELEDEWDVSDCLDDLAAVYYAEKDFSVAATLYGAAETIRDAIGAQRPLTEEEIYSERLRETKTALGESAFEEAWEYGSKLTMQKVIDYVLGLGV